MRFRCVTAAGSFFETENGKIIGKGIYFETFEGLKQILNFTYTLDLSPDGQFGSLHENGSWNGMVRSLKDDIFDIGMYSVSGLICKELTRTSARKWNFGPVFWHSFGLVTS